MNGGTLLEVIGEVVEAEGRRWIPVRIMTTDGAGLSGFASDRFLQCCETISFERMDPRARTSPPKEQNRNEVPAGRTEPNVSGTGSGFLVSSEGHIVTNQHVLQGCERISAAGFGEARLLRSDPVNDLAVVKLDHAPSEPPVEIQQNPPKLGEDVAVLGYPLGAFLGNSLSVTRGNVASLSGLAGDSRHLLITAPVQPGNSGGPVINADGSVVGVVVSRVSDIAMLERSGSLPQNVNFAIKPAVLLSFLETAGVVPKLHEPNEENSSSRPMQKAIEKNIAKTIQVICSQ
jgi:S1-C subfamily serine protease